MTVDAKTEDNTRATIPQHVLNRIESEWKQMRPATSSTPKYFQGIVDKD